jgi:hypothetical protein
VRLSFIGHLICSLGLGVFFSEARLPSPYRDTGLRDMYALLTCWSYKCVLLLKFLSYCADVFNLVFQVSSTRGPRSLQVGSVTVRVVVDTLSSQVDYRYVSYITPLVKIRYYLTSVISSYFHNKDYSMNV